MKLVKEKQKRRVQRKRRVRATIHGTASRPRLTVYRSNRHFYAQAIDDLAQHTIVSVSSLGQETKPADFSVKLGAEMGKKLKKKKIKSVVFDRNGFLYHGVVAAFADAIRGEGIKF